jgi:phosphatidylglycerophosphate synthase
VPELRTGPAAGLAGQVVLLAVLARTVGLGALGWAAGIATGLVVYALLSRGLGRSSTSLADRVTLTRTTLAGGVTALVADSLARPVPVAVLVALAAVALALDAVDGLVARRTGTTSALGARFDMEADAFLLLVLSAYAGTLVGWWVLAIGAMRYAYLAAGWLLPWLPGALPPRQWRKVVAAIQGVVLVVTAADVLPRPLAAGAAAVSLGLLVESFGWDVVWRWRRRVVGYIPPQPRPDEEARRGSVRGGAVRRG